MGSPEHRDVGTVASVGRRRTATELLHSALDGDAEAWSEIVDEYTDLLWWIARRYRLDDATAADVVQTVWLRLVQHGRSVRDPERLAAWLATTARREANTRVTRSQRQQPTEELDDRPINDRLGPEEQAIDSELTAVALAAFHRLSPSCRQLMGLLCSVPPKSYAEISALLDIPIGSIGPTRQRCLAILRSDMRGMGF